MTRPVNERIPVVVLAGFLGSGKTTLLNHLLRRSGGTRIGAVVNDFGSIEIDAMAVAGQVDSMVSLGDGCLCCAVDASGLDEVLDTLARPAAGMDVLVIEASGLAEPQTLIRMILASENPHIVYGGLVEVVDAAEFEATRTRHPEIDRHLRIADLVVLNKTDRVSGTVRRELLETLTGLCGGTPAVTADHGRVDPGLLFDRPRRERPAVEQLSFDQLFRADDMDYVDDEHRHHLHTGYQSVEFEAEVPMDPRRLLAFLDTRPPGLYRIKGFVGFGAADPGRRYAVHAVGGFLRFHPSAAPREEAVPTRLVLIGTGIDAAALRKELAACTVTSGPGGADPHSMWGVLRYVDSAAPSASTGAGDLADPGDFEALEVPEAFEALEDPRPGIRTWPPG